MQRKYKCLFMDIYGNVSRETLYGKSKKQLIELNNKQHGNYYKLLKIRFVGWG